MSYRDEEAIPMSDQDLLASNWKSLRTRVKQQWHALTDEDLDLIGGNRATLVSVLTEKYAYTEEQAQKQVEEFLAQAAARTQG